MLPTLTTRRVTLHIKQRQHRKHNGKLQFYYSANWAADYYNIITDKHFNLFANGILTSSKCSNLYHIENMKYVDDRIMSDKEVEEYFERHKNLQLAW